MYAKITLVLALLGGVLCGSGSCNDFLKEKPAFLTTCERQSAQFRQCLAKAFENIFSSWKDGVGGIESSRPIDPLLVTNFNVIEDAGNVTPITVKTNNITVRGLSEARVLNASMHDHEYSFKLTYLVPRIRLQGRYTAVGQVLLLRIDTSGDMLMDIVNGSYSVAVKVKLRPYKNYKFFDVKSLHFSVNSIEDMRMRFSDLFKDAALTNNTNAIFNERWRLLFDVFKPKIEQEINPVLLAHFRSVFQAVPAHFFIADAANDN